MSEISEILQNCKNGKLGEPATPEQIAEFEVRYQVRLPADVKEFFLCANGHSTFMSDIYRLDGWVTSDKVKYENDLLPDDFPDKQKYFVIGNYDILVWYWLIRLHADPNIPTPIIVALHHEITQVAASFTEFLRIYCLDSAESLLR